LKLIQCILHAATKTNWPLRRHRCLLTHTHTPNSSCHRTSQPCRVHSHANTTSPFIQCDTLLALPRAQCSHTALTPHLSLTVTEAHSDVVPYLTLHHTQPRNTLTCFDHPSLLVCHIITSLATRVHLDSYPPLTPGAGWGPS